MNLSARHQQLQAVTRRHFFAQTGLGFGSLALNSLLTKNLESNETADYRIPAKAKSVIYLHMAGSPSQLELFENKPALAKFHGQECPQEYLEGKRFAFIRGTPKMLGPQFQYAQHGETGQWISELLPGLASVIDDVCVIRSMHTDQFNHSPAQLLLQTGNPLLGYPAMGAWVTYGLGSETKTYPGLSSWHPVARHPAPENLFGALGSYLRSIKGSSVVPMAATPFCICRIPTGCLAQNAGKHWTPFEI